MAIHGRRARLLLEFEKLIKLEKRSDFIKVEPVNKIEGMPPEDYVITYTCRGIAGLNTDKSPQYSEFHQVSMKLSSNFPNQEPYLKWLTPIWHPNIEHKEPHHVCTNNVQNWYSTKSLDDLIVTLGEMVQYQHYHAKWMAPYPLDKEAADWVVSFAEPNGLLGPDKPVDERQILRPQKTRLRGAENPFHKAPRPSGRLKLGVKKKAEPESPNGGILPVNPYVTQETVVSHSQENVPPAAKAAGAGENPVGQPFEPVRRQGITLGLRTKEVVCMNCGINFAIPSVMPDSILGFFCPDCQAKMNLPA